MEYRLGNAKKIKSLGETEQLTCPKCQSKVALSVFANGELTLIPTFPLVQSGKVYFAVCPACAAVFQIETRAGKTFAKGERLAIGNFDLKPLTPFEADEKSDE
ncbi:MAG: hypothetical protein IJ168_11620 [Eubacterium sp.]|nr:hypothetical protein [Eubacterium sp.]